MNTKSIAIIASELAVTAICVSVIYAIIAMLTTFVDPIVRIIALF